MDKFETAPPLQPSDIDKIAKHIENKGWTNEENIEISKYEVVIPIHSLLDGILPIIGRLKI